MEENFAKTKKIHWMVLVAIFILVLSVFSIGMIGLRKSFTTREVSKKINSTSQISEITNISKPRTVLTTNKPSTVQSCKYWFKKVDKVSTKGSKKNVWMRYIMYCESGCNPIDNTSNRYFGLYNFAPATFRSKGGTNIFNGKQQIAIVSKMYNQGSAYRARQFPGCNSAFVRDWNKSHK